MSINIGDNNEIKNSNIGNEKKVVNIENSQNKTTYKKFYRKDGFWTGVISGIIVGLAVWGIQELIKFLVNL